MLATGYLLVIAPVLDLYAQRKARIADEEMLLPRLSVAAEQLPALRAAVAEAKAVASTRKIALDGASDAIAAANLQSHLEELAAAAGVEIGSSEGRAPENRGAYRRIGLRLAVSGEYEAVVKLLSAIETAAPPLIIANLQLHGGTRVILGSKYGAAPDVFAHAPDLDAMLRRADAALIIGDPALRLDPARLPYHVYDLGAEWVDMTGHPMVFAVWAGRRGAVTPKLGDASRESCRYGRERIEEIVAAEAGPRGFAPDLAREYLTRNIVHELAPRDYEGMELFLRYARQTQGVGAGAFSNRRMSMKSDKGMRRPRSGRLPFFGFALREQWSSSRAAVGKWETCFWFSTFPGARSRAVGMWESRAFWRDFQGAVESVGKPGSWFSTLSTGPAFPRPSLSGTSATTASGIAEAAWPWPRSSGERIRCR